MVGNFKFDARSDFDIDISSEAGARIGNLFIGGVAGIGFRESFIGGVRDFRNCVDGY